MLIHILETNSVKHVPIESFSDRIQCEHALSARSIVIDDKYRLDFVCIKTDKDVTVSHQHQKGVVDPLVLTPSK